MKKPSAARNQRILVIDDSQAIHDDFRRILGPAESGVAGLDEAEAALFAEASATTAAEGFDIDSAYQGQEAVAKIRQSRDERSPYALAFVDMRMPPGWDGLQTIEHMWKEDPDIQVVICTAYSDYSCEDILGRFGQVDRLLILKKPFDNVEVRQLASALTEKWNLAQQIMCRMNELDAAVRERTRSVRQQQRQLEKTHAQLLHAQKMESIGQLAAGISHEINTPTQFIGDNTRFLESSFDNLLKMVEKYAEVLDPVQGNHGWNERITEINAVADELDIEFLREEIPKAIEQTLDGVERVATIVRSMKEFSHPGGAEKNAIDLNKAIQTTITVARNEWKYVAEVETDLDTALPFVSCLPGDINQVILNLIINAAHAIADVVGDGGAGKGTITVRARDKISGAT